MHHAAGGWHGVVHLVWALLSVIDTPFLVV
jgi:hypothetical protein